MKTIVLCAVALALLSAVGRCDEAPPLGSDIDVPYTNWTYDAHHSLVMSGLLHGFVPPGFYSGPPFETTRYLFAINIVSSVRVDAGEDGGENRASGTTALERRDAYSALLREFTPELKSFGVKVQAAEGSLIFDQSICTLKLVDDKLRVTRVDFAQRRR